MFLLIQLQSEACNFTKSITLPWVHFTFFFKLYKWYQITYMTNHIYDVSYMTFAESGLCTGYIDVLLYFMDITFCYYLIIFQGLRTYQSSTSISHFILVFYPCLLSTFTKILISFLILNFLSHLKNFPNVSKPPLKSLLAFIETRWRETCLEPSSASTMELFRKNS